MNTNYKNSIQLQDEWNIQKKLPGSFALHQPIISQKGLQYFKILSSFIKLLESESRVTTHISRHLLGTLLFIQHFCSGESGSKIEASTNISLKKALRIKIYVILYSSNNELLPFLHWSMAFQKLVQYLSRSSPYLLLLRLTSPAGMHNSKHSVGTFLASQHFSSCDRSVECKKQMLYSYKGGASKWGLLWSPHFDFH